MKKKGLAKKNATEEKEGFDGQGEEKRSLH